MSQFLAGTDRAAARRTDRTAADAWFQEAYLTNTDQPATILSRGNSVEG